MLKRCVSWRDATLLPPQKDKSGRTALQFIQRQDSSPGEPPSPSADGLPRTPSASSAKYQHSVLDIVAMLTAAEATSRDASEGLLSP